MPEIKEPIGNYWTNCKKSEQFKTEQPEQYKESLQLLAALQDVRAKKEELRDYERDLVEAIFKLMPQREMDVGGIGRITSTQAINRMCWNKLLEVNCFGRIWYRCRRFL